MKPPRPEGRGFASRAYAPGKENKHFHIAPLDPVLKDGRSALRQHFVRGERAGQPCQYSMRFQCYIHILVLANRYRHINAFLLTYSFYVLFLIVTSVEVQAGPQVVVGEAKGPF